MPTINKSTVDAASTPSDKPVFLADDKLKGFRLKVTPAGAKIYQVQSRVRGDKGAPVVVTIGTHGEPRAGGVLTAEAARREAIEIKSKMLNGINPNLERKDRAEVEAVKNAERKAKTLTEELTLRAVFESYIVAKKLKESTAYVYRCDLFKCLSDWLELPLNAITKEMVEKRHRYISEDHRGQANHTFRILRAVYNYAISTYEDHKGESIIKGNPVRRLSEIKVWNRLKPRQDIIADHDLEAWFKAVNRLESDTARDYLTLLLMTGLRKNEAASMEWASVDFKARKLTVKDTKNGRDHSLPLTARLYDLLQKRWQARFNGFVFGSAESASGYLSDYRYHTDVVAGIVPFTLHTCRRTFSSIAARSLPEYTVKRLTNHTDSADVTQTHYVVYELEQLIQPMELISKHLEKHGKLGLLKKSKVVAIRSVRVK